MQALRDYQKFIDEVAHLLPPGKQFTLAQALVMAGQWGLCFLG
jgi:hypothetical protein